MSLKLITAPTELPLTLDEAKDHLRRTDTAMDAIIMRYIYHAVSMCDGAEGILNRALITQTWELKVDRFPWGPVDIPLPPLQSVSSVKYLDDQGVEQVLDTSVYDVFNAGSTTRRGYIKLAYDQTWPTTRAVDQAVTITFVAGYGDRNSIPEYIKTLLMFFVAESCGADKPVMPNTLMRNPAFDGLIQRARFPVI